MIDDLVVTTSRLTLRPIRLEDFEGWAAMTADAETMRFLGGPHTGFPAWLMFRVLAGGWQLDGFSRFSVIERKSGDWVGWAGPLNPDGWFGPEIGWAIIRDRWGRGYATEAAVATIDWSFKRFDWTEITHCIAPDNVTSQQVARKLGSSKRRLGCLPSLVPGHEFPVEIWGQSREQWRASRPQ